MKRTNMKLIAVIEKSEDSFYQISTDTLVCGCSIGGYGHSASEAKKDFFECMAEMKELSIEEGKEWPEKIDVEFAYDIPSLFNHFDCINVSRFAQTVGINRSKMRAYRNGLCNASEKTTAKIVEGLKTLGEELCMVAI